MDVISDNNKHTQDFVASRNDSGWAENESLIEDYDAGAQFLADGDVKTQFAFQWPSADDNDTGSGPADHCEDGGEFGAYRQAATPSSLFGRTFKRDARTSVADGCISPGTTTLVRNLLSKPSESDISNGLAANSRGAAALQLVQPRRKSRATVGQVQRITSSDQSTEDVSTTVCMEESKWHRHKPSRLLSYQSISTSSSEDFGDVLTSRPNPRSPDSEESPDEWMMAEDRSYPFAASPSNSRKSFNFVKKKSKARALDRQSSSQRISGNRFKSAISNLENIRAAHPSRHYSYGATLDLPPIGIQTHRDSSDCKVSEVEAVLEDTDLVPPNILPPTLGELEAQLDRGHEPLSTFQKWLIGSLLGLLHTSLLGSSLFLLLRPKVWNESRFAIAAMPCTIWLCLVLHVMQFHRRRRRAVSRLERSEAAVDNEEFNEG